MASQETPIKTYFRILKDCCGIGMAEACRELLSHEEVRVGRRTIVPWDLANNETNRAPLTNTISNSLPGELPFATFADFTVQVPFLFSMVVEMRAERDEISKREAASALLSELCTEYANDMVAALEYTSVNADIFDNARDGIASLRTGHTDDRALLAFMLVTITGCLGNPQYAASITESYGRRTFKLNILNELPITGDMRAGLCDASFLGVQRIMGSNVRGRTHRLDPEGTTFGTLPQPETGSYVADVDNSVSNEHLRIWEEDGRWLAEGLGSLHGTYIQRGNERIVVEPPADELGDFSYESEIEVLPGDVIVMGTTSFEVLYFNWGE
jgi:hypothetical protein